MQKLHYGFLDESGVIEEQARKENYFVTTLILDCCVESGWVKTYYPVRMEKSG